jgi:hypothetical protein
VEVDALTITILVIGVLAVSIIIVALDPEHRDRVYELGPVFLYLLAALLCVGLYVGLSATNFEPIQTLISSNVDETSQQSKHVTLSFIGLWLIAPLVAVADIGLFFLVILAGVWATIMAVIETTKAFPTLISIPYFAFLRVLRGLYTVLSLPFVGVRALLYAILHPPALKKIKRATRAKDADYEELKEASAKLQKEYEETQRDLLHPWRRPTMQLKAWIQHYGRFVSRERLRAHKEYTAHIGDTADIVHDHLDRYRKRREDERHDS